MKSRLSVPLLLLGFSSGLPFSLAAGNTLKVWLSRSGVDVKTLGLLSLLALPYSLKFLWAPLLDRYTPGFWGGRRGWIAVFQLGLGAVGAFLAFMEPATAMKPVSILIFLVSLLSASQDIVFEAWRVEVLDERQRGTGASIAVLGYRLGILLAGAGALLVVDRIGWRNVLLLLSLLQVALVAVTWSSPDPVRSPSPPKTLRQAVVEPFRGFLRSRGPVRLVAMLAMVCLFKWGVYLVMSSSAKFLVVQGFTDPEIGVLNGFAVAAPILGTLAGGLAMYRLSVRSALWIFGALQGACGLLYWLLAMHGHDWTLAVAAVSSENFFVGMGSAALVAWMMEQCDPMLAVTQFALLSSAMAFSRDILTSPWGWVQTAVGWPGFYLATIFVALPGLVLLGLTGRTEEKITASGS